MKRVLVCGGRRYEDWKRVRITLDSVLPDLVIEGGATGADHLAREWASFRCVPCLTHPAQWDKLGRAAGPTRNEAMLKLWRPVLVVAFPGGDGTANMVRIAKEAGVPVMSIK